MNFSSKWAKILLAAAISTSLLVVAGCGGDKPKAGDTKVVEGTVMASGSTALLPLLKIGQEEFQKEIDNLAKDGWKIHTVGVAHSGFIISIILERDANSESELGLLSFEKTN